MNTNTNTNTNPLTDHTIIPVKEMDYLDEDKPIRGQNYVCMSFVSPEDVLHDKDVFFFSQFMKQFGRDMDTLLTTLQAKYKGDAGLFDTIRDNHSYVFKEDDMQDQYRFFKGNSSADLEREFHAKQNFRTTMRGFKVRGVYDTFPEAKIRAEVLKKMGDKFDIFIAQVGCWCPWSPNPQDLQDQEYAEGQLNTLMKHYKDNLKQRDEYYEMRKTELTKPTVASASDATPTEGHAELEKPDVWLAKKIADLKADPQVNEVADENQEKKDESIV